MASITEDRGCHLSYHFPHTKYSQGLSCADMDRRATETLAAATTPPSPKIGHRQRCHNLHDYTLIASRDRNGPDLSALTGTLRPTGLLQLSRLDVAPIHESEKKIQGPKGAI